MKITSDTVRETRYYDRSIYFEGREPELWSGYNHSGKFWLPHFATAKYVHGKEIDTIHVVGKILKKDGTPSTHTAKRRYVTPQNPAWGRSDSWATTAPGWLLEAFGIEVPA